MVDQPSTVLNLEQAELDLLAAAMNQARREAAIVVSMVVVADGLRQKLDRVRTDRALARRRGDELPPAAITCVEYELQILQAVLGEHDHSVVLAGKVRAAADDLSIQRRRRASNRALQQAVTAANVVQQPTDAGVLQRLMLHEAKVDKGKE